MGAIDNFLKNLLVKNNNDKRDPYAALNEKKVFGDVVNKKEAIRAVDLISKGAGTGLDSGIAIAKGGLHAMTNPNLATYKNITEIPGLFTEEGRAKTLNRLFTGAQEVANKYYPKPGDALTKYSSVTDPADKRIINAASFYADPFLAGSLAYKPTKAALTKGANALKKTSNKVENVFDPKMSPGYGAGSADVPIYTRPDGSRTEFATQKNIDTVSAYFNQNPGSTNITASEVLGINISDVSRIKSYLGLQRGQDTKLGYVSLGRNKYNNDRMFVTKEKYEEAINLLTDGDLTQLAIASQLKLGETYVRNIAKKAGFTYNKRETLERKQDLQDMIAYLDKLDGSALTQATHNSKLIKQLKEKYGLSYQQIIDDVSVIKAELLGKPHGNNRRLKGLDFKGTDLTDVLKKFPSGRSVVANMRAAGISEDSIKQIENVQNSVKVVANNKTVFEHAMPQSLVKEFNLDPNYLMFGERTTDFLNMYKARFDGPVKNLAVKFEKTAKKYRDGKIGNKEYNNLYKEYITKIKKMETEVMDATDGYKIGYMDFVNGVPTPATPHFSALTSQIGDLGPQTTALINFFKNAKHHNALLKKYKNNPSNFPSLNKRFDKSIESGKVSFETEAAKIYDQIKDFTTPKQFKNFYEKNKNNKFFQALFNPGKRGGIAKNLIPYKGSGRTAVPTAITGSLVGQAVLANENNELAKSGAVKPKRGLVDEPGGYAGEESGVFKKYLENKETRENILNPIYGAVPEGMRSAIDQIRKDEEQDLTLAESRSEGSSERIKFEREQIDVRSARQKLSDVLNPPRQVRYPIFSLPKLFTDSYPMRQERKRLAVIPAVMGHVANQVLNELGGDEKTFQERFPGLAKNLAETYSPLPQTSDEAKYIDGIKDINRAQEAGITNLTYNTFDLIFSGIDLASFGTTDLTTRLRDSYEKMDRTKPEAFVGQMVSLLVEYGVPGGVVTKVLNRARRALRARGMNVLPRYVADDVVGKKRKVMQISNVAKRVSSTAAIFGVTDFIGGGPYSTLKEMLPENQALFSTTEDTKGLTGNALIAANFRNRVKMAKDGAIIGALFPVVGPALVGGAKITGRALTKPRKMFDDPNEMVSILGAPLKVVGEAFTGVADLLAGKTPYTTKEIPIVGKAIGSIGSKVSSTIQSVAAFTGKQVFTRAALGFYDTAYQKQKIISGIGVEKTFNRALPEFKEWRTYSVNSKDPLESYLASIDNKLAAFRDIGKLTKDAFGLDQKANFMINSKTRTINKYLDQVHNEAYKMARTFEERYQRYGEHQTFQKKYLDEVYEYLEGTRSFADLGGGQALKNSAKNLKDFTTVLKKEFKDVLDDDNPLTKLLGQSLDGYFRKSFGIFTNANYKPPEGSAAKAKVFIKKLIEGNEGMKLEARQAGISIDEYAELQVADILHTAYYEGLDPLRALNKIVKKIGLDDIKILTGEELPKVLKTLLGEEKNLKASVLQTTGNIIAGVEQKKALDKIAVMGLEKGWLFNTAERAKTAGGILNAAQITDLKGSGFLPSSIQGLWATPELAAQLSGYNIFDSFLKSKAYQNLIAFKAMVQSGKTLYSPSTQMRNLGSASLFALNAGHIGGDVSVTQGFKLVLDDIYGAGNTLDESLLIKDVRRGLELGVFDENIQANELGAVLRDLKGSKNLVTGEPTVSDFNMFIQRVGESKINQTVQRLYAGGDNVWKHYGWKFYQSQLKNGVIKNIDDVKAYYKNIIGQTFDEFDSVTGARKGVVEGIEEIGAYLLRETYPTYSRVPPVIQALRKLPLGNFVSFPAEMIRTSAQTTSLALKHIASDNPNLRSMGYKTLMGQFTTAYGLNEGAQQLAGVMTGVTQDKVQAYSKELGPSFLSGHTLIPVTRQQKDGSFKAFDMSTYNPYDYITAPIESFINELNTTRLDPDKIEGEVYARYMDAVMPLFAFAEPFVSETIGLEPFMDIWARKGQKSNGQFIWSNSDHFGVKVNKSFEHIFETISPGILRTVDQIGGALTLDVKQGKIVDLSDTLFKLFGASVLLINPVKALDFKASEIRKIRENAFKTEAFFGDENALQRGPIYNSEGRKVGHNMANELNSINEEAFRAQFEMYKLFKRSLETGLLTYSQIEDTLGKDGRDVINLERLLDGEFSPVGYSYDALDARAERLQKLYRKQGIRTSYDDFFPEGALDDVIDKWEGTMFKNFIDQDREPGPVSMKPPVNNTPIETQTVEPQVPPLPDSGTPIVNPKQTASVAGTTVSPRTGLTDSESVLLSPTDQLYRRRQRGIT